MLANAGYRVFGLARRYNKLAELASELAPESFYPVEFDITRHENFGKVISGIAAKGQIFALVNNAGYVEPGAIEDIGMTDLRSQFETNFFGLVGLTKQVLPYMMNSREGRIVNISSMAGLVSLPLVGAYCAAKHALEATSDTLRMELWGSGIRVVNVNPGIIQTNTHRIMSEKIGAHRSSRFARAYTKYLQEDPKGSPAAAVGKAVLEAVESGNPKQRYLVGSAKERAAIWLRPYVPDGMFYSQVAKRILS